MTFIEGCMVNLWVGSKHHNGYRDTWTAFFSSCTWIGMFYMLSRRPAMESFSYGAC